MATAGSRGILNAHGQHPKVVTIRDFPSARVVPLTPVDNETAEPRVGSRLKYSSRVRRAKFVSDEVNAQRAEFMAAMLQRELIGRVETVWLTANEDLVVADAERERHPYPAPQLSLPKHHEKVVRFADEAEIEQFDFVATEQCELSSAHELCLKTFLCRVEQAYNFSHAFNKAEARDVALRLREEVEMQQEEPEEEGKTAPGNINSFFVDQSSCLYEASECQQKRAKKSFWILDARRTPQQQHASRNPEGKRWQDLVRYAAG
eukprot:TRINITY_DN26403_c0_g1_i1.p1 TRINITY_DN26403_c0_g1~~TRINITY_DN26403_c0_g1_i1.p1  ORF type:complete len:262 (+),score=55.86 TRINITY_DN26403_c0_g1_i1:66-851(+)